MLQSIHTHTLERIFTITVLSKTRFFLATTALLVALQAQGMTGDPETTESKTTRVAAPERQKTEYLMSLAKETKIFAEDLVSLANETKIFAEIISFTQTKEGRQCISVLAEGGKGLKVTTDTFVGTLAPYVTTYLRSPSDSRTPAEIMALCPNLSGLILWCNKIGDEEAKGVAEALKGNTTLTRLMLWGNQIRNAGIQALLNAIRGNEQLPLEYLYLYGNTISDDLAAQFLALAQKRGFEMDI